MAKKTDKTETEETEHVEIEYKITDEKKLSYGICKATEVDEDERTVIAVISTGVIDRDMEVLSPKGVQTENFEKNPVVPWSHNTSEPPIGKALWIKKGTKRITAKVKFATTERANEVWELFKGGFLKAFSVGFMVLAGHRPTPDDIKKNPILADARFIIDKWELLEFSPVTVPANPEALAQAVKSKELTLSDGLKKELHIEIAEPEEKPEEILIKVSEFKGHEEIFEVEPIFEVDKI